MRKARVAWAASSGIAPPTELSASTAVTCTSGSGLIRRSSVPCSSRTGWSVAFSSTVSSVPFSICPKVRDGGEKTAARRRRRAGARRSSLAWRRGRPDP